MLKSISLFFKTCSFLFLLSGQITQAAFIQTTYHIVKNQQPLPQHVAIDAANHLGETALHYAIKCDDLETAQRLIAMGADVNQSPNKYGPPLHYVKSIAAAQLLLEHGAQLNQCNDQHENELSHAISQQNIELVAFFLEQGSLVNLGLLNDGQGRIYPIWKSLDDAWLTFLDATEHLWKRYHIRIEGAVAHSTTIAEFEAHRMDKAHPYKMLYQAWAYCAYRALADLQRIGQCMDTPEKPATTPLIRAVKEGCEDIVRLVLEYGADVHAQGQRRDGNALCYLVASNRPEKENLPLLEILIEYGAHQTPFQKRWRKHHAYFASSACTFAELAIENNNPRLAKRLAKASTHTTRTKQPRRLRPRSAHILNQTLTTVLRHTL